jgi:hypothetical protein
VTALAETTSRWSVRSSIWPTSGSTSKRMLQRSSTSQSSRCGVPSVPSSRS